MIRADTQVQHARDEHLAAFKRRRQGVDAKIGGEDKVLCTEIIDLTGHVGHPAIRLARHSLFDR